MSSTEAAAQPPLLLAVCGASAQVLALRALQWLLEADQSVDLILSRGAFEVWRAELGLHLPVAPEEQAQVLRRHCGSLRGQLRCHRWNDQAAPPASGSYRTRGMLILPATMGTVGRLAAGVAQDLIERCADVHLKEARPLVIAPREMPWNLIHLRNLTTLAEAGARIAPPSRPGITSPAAWTTWSISWWPGFWMCWVTSSGTCAAGRDPSTPASGLTGGHDPARPAAAARPAPPAGRPGARPAQPGGTGPAAAAALDHPVAAPGQPDPAGGRGRCGGRGRFGLAGPGRSRPVGAPAGRLRRPAAAPASEDPMDSRQPFEPRQPFRPEPWPERDPFAPAPTVSVPYRVVRAPQAEPSPEPTASGDDWDRPDDGSW